MLYFLGSYRENISFSHSAISVNKDVISEKKTPGTHLNHFFFLQFVTH